MHLSLKEAQTMTEVARAYAETIGVPMTIAVVDAGGHLLTFARMDKAILGSIDIALRKAQTSVLFANPSEGGMIGGAALPLASTLPLLSTQGQGLAVILATTLGALLGAACSLATLRAVGGTLGGSGGRPGSARRSAA